MRLSIMACALLALAATPSWAERAPSDPHHPASVATPAEAPATPASKEEQAPARPDLLQLMEEHAETHTDHGDDHSNCCKVKKPAQ